MRPSSLHTRLEMKQAKALILSPQMQQSLSLLQLPVMELHAALAQEMETNPILEYSDAEERIENEDILYQVEERYRSTLKGSHNDLQSTLENTISYESSPFSSLMQQAREIFFDPHQLHIAEWIIGNLNDSGFLEISLSELSLHVAHPVDDIETILKEIQRFDPPGIAARSLQESFLIQLKKQGKEKSLAYQIIENSFDEITHNRLQKAAKQNGVASDEIQSILENEISKLAFHPGHILLKEEAKTITPDVFLKATSEGVTIDVNEKSIPPFRINPYYLRLLGKEHLGHETRSYIQEKIASGKWLLRNLCERQKTLHKITEQLFFKQKEFFLSSNGNLKSLTMKELGDSLGLHESTIARAISGKHLSSPRGIHPLRWFFTHAYTTENGETLSAPAVKDLLHQIIKEENPGAPLSDEAISKKMREKGIPCARRTIAKYRKELGLGTRIQRMRKRH